MLLTGRRLKSSDLGDSCAWVSDEPAIQPHSGANASFDKPLANRRPFLLSLSEPRTPDTPHTVALFRAGEKPFHAVSWLRLPQSVCSVAGIAGKNQRPAIPLGTAGLRSLLTTSGYHFETWSLMFIGAIVFAIYSLVRLPSLSCMNLRRHPRTVPKYVPP